MEHLRLVEILKAHDIRPTLQRLEIGKIILEKHQHLTATSLSNEINKNYSKVSRASIFNTINLFEKKGLLKRIEISDGEYYYDSNLKPHHHFIDKEKKQIYDIEIPFDLESKIRKVMKEEMEKNKIHIQEDFHLNITATM